MDAPDDLRVESATSGAPTLVRNGRYVHSRRDPEREAARAMEAIVRREPPALIVLGLGLGYHVRYVLDHCITKVIVYEPSRRVLELAMREGPLRTGDRTSMHLARNAAELSDALAEHAAGGFESFELPGFHDLDETARAARRILDAFSSRVEINRNTLQRFGRLWVRNLCSNLGHIVHANGVSQLDRALEGVPVLLLAAGPSLDQLTPLLPRLARRCVVVAVDTAVAPCMRAGIEPDFAVVVDPQYWNARHLDRVDPQRTILVSEASAHPAVFRRFQPPVFLCSSVFPLGRAFENALGRFGSLGAGGSVATSAWDLCRLLGASAVYTAGLDLGFPDGRTHCSGSYFEELALVLASRVKPAEGVVFRYTWSASPAPVPANDGTSLLSDRRMEVYRNWFVSQLKLPGAPTTRSVTRGGSQMQGVDLSSVSELLRLPRRRTEIQARLESLRTGSAPTVSPAAAERHDLLLARVAELEAMLLDLAEVAQTGVRAVAKLEHRYEAGTAPDFSPLLPIDQSLSAHPAGEIGGFLVQEAIARIRGGYGSQSMQEQLHASRSIYEGLAEAARFHADALAAAALRLRKSPENPEKSRSSF